MTKAEWEQMVRGTCEAMASMGRAEEENEAKKPRLSREVPPPPPPPLSCGGAATVTDLLADAKAAYHKLAPEQRQQFIVWLARGAE
jgi:hypothetical protein